MKRCRNLDAIITRIHEQIDYLLNNPRALRYRLSVEKERKEIGFAKEWSGRLRAIKICNFERSRNPHTRALFYSSNKWPVKEDYYKSPEWRILRKLVLAQFPRRKVCGRCFKRTQHPNVHHVYGLQRAVFELLCEQCHLDHHYIIRVTKKLKRDELASVALK